MKTIINRLMVIAIALVLVLSGCITMEDTISEPSASFSFEIDEFQVSFSNQSENAEIYLWDFGDGTTSAEENPVKEYSNNGTFTVELTATGEGGSASFSQSIEITAVSTPLSNFSFVVNEYEVIFTNLSKYAASYAWSFGDGTTSTEESPTKDYSENGTFTVELTASGEGGSDSFSQSIEITAVPTPVSDFSYVVNEYEVTFTNLSEQGNSYVWDFGDKTTSTEVNPVKTYDENGTYDVVLSVTGDEGTVTSTKEVTIAVSTLLPKSFIANFYTLEGNLFYEFSEDGEGDYIKVDDKNFYYDDTKDVSVSSVIVVGFGTYDVYKVSGMTTSNVAETFYFYQEGTEFKDTNKLFVSLSAEDAGYTIYAKVGGRTVNKVVYNSERGSFVYNYGFAEWCEYQTDGGTYCDFTEVSRDDWSVVLRKENGDRVVLNTNSMLVQFEPSGGIFEDLYTIIEVSR